MKKSVQVIIPYQVHKKRKRDTIKRFHTQKMTFEKAAENIIGTGSKIIKLEGIKLVILEGKNYQQGIISIHL